jgi:excisionase family DNA binding protein
VPDSSLMSVREAADALGVGPAAVRKSIASGALPAIKRGRSWWLEAAEIDRWRRQPRGQGRALSPGMAWAVLLLASGDEDGAVRAAGRDRYASRMRAWLADHRLADCAPRLRARARREDFDAHPSELARILARADVRASGLSAGQLVDLVGGERVAELYAPVGRRAALIDDHALNPGAGAVRVRWVRDDLWPLLDAYEGHAPRAAVLVDLLESDDPRARREAARALAA